MLSNLFMKVPPDLCEELCFNLGYRYHGGSGLGWSRADVLSADFDEAMRQMERLNETRQRESAALKAAYRKGGH